MTLQHDSESIYKGEVDIRYIFEESPGSDFLLVGFSAFPPQGGAPTYYSVEGLRELPYNRLFILDDFGIPEYRGSYYLAFNGDFRIERSVMSLIDHICSSCLVPKRNVIAFGSSKGAFTSLYFAFKHGLGAAIVVAPQIFLGTYLCLQPELKNVARYIAGGSGQREFDILNALMADALMASKSEPFIFIHVGTLDLCYTYHIVPFEQMLKVKGYSIELDLAEYDSHNDWHNLFLHYRPFLLQSIEKTVSARRAEQGAAGREEGGEGA